MRSTVRIIGDFWVEASAHLNVCSVTLNTHFCSFFFLFLIGSSTRALILRHCKVRWISPPPSLLSSLGLSLHVRAAVQPSSLFILPRAFLSSSFNLCLLSSPLFPRSYLSHLSRLCSSQSSSFFSSASKPSRKKSFNYARFASLIFCRARARFPFSFFSRSLSPFLPVSPPVLLCILHPHQLPLPPPPPPSNPPNGSHVSRIPE